MNVEQKLENDMGLFERYLTLWVVLCIAAGIGLGHLFQSFFQTLGQVEIARINLPVAVLIWLMIIPMLLKIDFSALHHVKEHWRGVGGPCSSTGRSNPSPCTRSPCSFSARASMDSSGPMRWTM